jgi:hypothetical protein
MKTLKLTLPLVVLTGFALAGCPTDDMPPGETESTSEGETTTTGSPTTTPMDTSTTTVGPDTDPDTSGGTTETEGNTTEVEPGPFEFNDTPFEDYTQFDRKGFPAVNTGLNILGDKDAYNAGSPADDANLAFISNIVDSLDTLHLGDPANQVMDNTGLDDDLMGLGFVPCVTPGAPSPMDTCDDQGGPFAIPDVITVDLDDMSGFPNGRRLEDPAIDVIFAVILLDIVGGTHTPFTFLDLDMDGVPGGATLNPFTIDVEFPGAFPYLAAAN